MLRDTYVEVDLDRLAGNVQSIRNRVGDEVAIAAVIKADAYGHGSVMCAKTIMENGGDYLAVAALTEALELRQSGLDCPILVMGYTSDENLSYCVTYDLTQCIFTQHQGERLNQLAEEQGKRAKVHIKYDTGFNRLGFQDSPESIEIIRQLVKLPALDCEGMFSHLALAGVEADKTQFAHLEAAIEAVEVDGFHFRYRHICDSIAAVDYPEFRMNMIRPGALLYGMKSFRKYDLELQQVLKFKTKIAYIKTLKVGEGVSYNYRFQVERETKLATIPVGYADGYPRNLFEVGEMTVRGQRVPVVGVICMDQCMLDVTDVPDVSEGDEVIICGDVEENAVNFQELSVMGQTNKNELLCRFTRRTPRRYFKGGQLVQELNYLLPDMDEREQEV